MRFLGGHTVSKVLSRADTPRLPTSSQQAFSGVKVHASLETPADFSSPKHQHSWPNIRTHITSNEQPHVFAFFVRVTSCIKNTRLPSSPSAPIHKLMFSTLGRYANVVFIYFVCCLFSTPISVAAARLPKLPSTHLPCLDWH